MMIHYNLNITVHWDSAITVQHNLTIITDSNAKKKSEWIINAVKDLLILKFLVTLVSLSISDLDKVQLSCRWLKCS